MAGCDDSKAHEIELELEELQQFLAQSKTRGVQSELSALVTRKQQELERLKSANDEAMDVEDQPLVEEVVRTVATPKPVKVSHAVPDHEINAFTEISSFGWEDDGYGKNKVMVYIMSGLDGVGDLPKDQVKCEFTSTSFDLQIFGLHGKNYRLVRHNLEKEIDASKSGFRVKKNRVTMSLWKQDKNSTWMNLTAKNPTKSAGGADNMTKNGDPTAGIMEMMKNMYDEGDDEMKRTIAKAWTESREKTTQGTL